MNIVYEKKDAMTFIGFHTEIRPDEGYQKIVRNFGTRNTMQNSHGFGRP